MGARQKDWARRWTEKLRELLGGKCSKCGSTEDLTFDIKIVTGVRHHSTMEWSQRITHYRREYEKNNLDLLCNKCNGTKRDDLILTSDPEPEPDPF